MGRLGNQLFQYSFARWLECKTEYEVRFDLSMTRRHGIAGTNAFVDAVNARAIPGSRIFPAPVGRLGSAGAHLRRVLGPDRAIMDLTASGIGQAQFSEPAWWVGYWQQLKFAEVAREELRELLGIGECPAQQGQQVVVHVRRGDYVGLGLSLTPDWYRRAVQTALAGLRGADVMVVSDSPLWCQKNLVLDSAFTVRVSGTVEDDFRALVHADVLIASASTFSWWAGFLGGSRVVYPAGAFADIGVGPDWCQVAGR